MCGIAGYLSFHAAPEENTLRKMAAAIHYRGPDAEGFFTEKICGLAHRRLSIIDLSNAANQPMFSAGQRYVIVYNGEVYNFREIGEQLKKDKRDFIPQTTSDTEIILEAFAHYGRDFVSKLNGMFAIAIYDREQECLWLFRDRIGVKPLFVFQGAGIFAFASEMKALMQHPLVRQETTLNPDAIAAYLHLGYIPGPATISKGILKMTPGTAMKITRDGSSQWTYWKASEKMSAEVVSDENHALEILEKLLNSSVAYRMISDVPFGTFLSGGIDSSIVTAFAQKNSAVPVNTFSIGFDVPGYDESSHARLVAAHLGTKHHEFRVSEQDALDMMPDMLTLYDEPYADSSGIPTMLVSRLARQHVTMTLSGDGGDELFSGYGMYRWAERLDKKHIRLLRHPLSLLLAAGNERQRRAATLFRYPSELKKPSHIFSQEQLFFSEKEICALMNPGIHAALDIIPEKNWPRKLSAPELQSVFDLEYYLRDDLLVKVDRATMRYSLESRVPLLDYRIVEFSLNLSHELKYKNGISKYLLKKLLFKQLPEYLFDRPKWGFAVPLRKWLKDDLRTLTFDYLSHDMVKKHGFVKPNVVEDLLRGYYKKDISYLYNRIWALIALHAYAEKNL